MKGRKRQPIESQIAKGDPAKRGKGTLNRMKDAQVKVAPGLPECPDYMTGRARDIWLFWAEELKTMKLDKRPDGPMLEGACFAYAAAIQAELILQKDGPVITEYHILEDGEAVPTSVKKHPAVEVRNRSWMLVKAFCVEFGFSPTSRQRLHAEAEEDSDEDLMKLLSGTREVKPSSALAN